MLAYIATTRVNIFFCFRVPFATLSVLTGHEKHTDSRIPYPYACTQKKKKQVNARIPINKGIHNTLQFASQMNPGLVYALSPQRRDCIIAPSVSSKMVACLACAVARLSGPQTV